MGSRFEFRLGSGGFSKFSAFSLLLDVFNCQHLKVHTRCELQLSVFLTYMRGRADVQWRVEGWRKASVHVFLRFVPSNFACFKCIS